MNPVPRPMVFGAATILGGVCAVGLYIGIHGSLSRPYADAETPVSSPSVAAVTAAAASSGAAAAVEARPLQSDLPPSSAPAQLAEAKPKPKPATDEDQGDVEAPASEAPAVQPHPPPEPPPLYPPIDQSTPSQPSNDNTPPY